MISLVNKKEFGPYPDHVAVIGGGRWARVLIEVLCDLVPSSVGISAHSPHNARGISTWASERGLGTRVLASSEFPNFLSGTSSAVIIANAARDHEEATNWALSKRVPVLVEKPLTLNAAASQRLSEKASRQQSYFAAAHVFLFARYMDTFSKLITDKDSIQFIRVHWMDPKSESRYGETKSYDPGLPVYADWLPHVISILGILTTSPTQTCEALKVLRGGAHLDIDLKLGNVPCNIQLTRNGQQRQRTIEVTTQQEKYALDFTNEPGIINFNSTTLNGDPDWDIKARPVARMVEAFLIGAAGGIRDKRLDITIGLRASHVIEQVASLYDLNLFSWLNKNFVKLDECDDSDLRYTLREILHAKDPYSSQSNGQRIDYVCQYIEEHITNDLLTDLPKERIKQILSQDVSFLIK